MANVGNTYQQMHTVSIPRNGLVAIAKSNELDELDYKILLMLFTQLDGYNAKTDTPNNKKFHDPLNFKKIDISQISDTLCIKKKEIKKRIERIYSLKFDINFGNDEIRNMYLLDKGSNETVKDGYRFTI